MKLTLSNLIFDSEDLLSGKINQKNFSEQEIYVLNFIKRWQTDKINFDFITSGSTGEPKEINLFKEQLAYSAQQTLNFLFQKKEPRKMLLCLNPYFIGGSQVITRAIVSNSDLIVIPHSSNPLQHLTSSIDLVSLVPLQIEKILAENPEKFSLIKNVLIGGAELRPSLVRTLEKIKTTNFYQTYGMTETASHVALKVISKDFFKQLGDVQIDVDSRQCLKIKGTVTRDEWIQTNDLVEIGPNGFKWLGRVDWVINSGGVKISPEVVELKIASNWPAHTVVVSSIPDDMLGERVVLISDQPILDKIKETSVLSEYEIPKQEFILDHLPKNENGKLARREIREWLRKH